MRNDVESARAEANRDSRPWGPTGPAPQEQWNTRIPIFDPDRQRFGSAVAAAFNQEVQLYSQSYLALPGQPPVVPFDASQQALLTRRAIRRVLIKLGLLSTRRIAN